MVKRIKGIPTRKCRSCGNETVREINYYLPQCMQCKKDVRGKNWGQKSAKIHNENNY